MILSLTHYSTLSHTHVWSPSFRGPGRRPNLRVEASCLFCVFLSWQATLYSLASSLTKIWDTLVLQRPRHRGPLTLVDVPTLRFSCFDDSTHCDASQAAKGFALYKVIGHSSLCGRCFNFNPRQCRGGGWCNPPPMSFSEIAAEPLGGSRCNFA